MKIEGENARTKFFSPDVCKGWRAVIKEKKNEKKKVWFGTSQPGKYFQD